jgi:hypothetical protein
MELIYDISSTYNSEVMTRSLCQLKLHCKAKFCHCVTPRLRYVCFCYETGCKRFLWCPPSIVLLELQCLLHPPRFLTGNEVRPQDIHPETWHFIVIWWLFHKLTEVNGTSKLTAELSRPAPIDRSAYYEYLLPIILPLFLFLRLSLAAVCQNISEGVILSRSDLYIVLNTVLLNSEPNVQWERKSSLRMSLWM